MSRSFYMILTASQPERRRRSQHEADSWFKRRVRQHEGAIADSDRMGQMYQGI